LTKSTANENKGNDPQRLNVLMIKEILPNGNIKNIEKTVRRIFILILGLKG